MKGLYGTVHASTLQGLRKSVLSLSSYLRKARYLRRHP